MVKRIFLAVNLPKEAKSELLGYQNKWPELPAHWSGPENLHVTLVFLGNTSEEEIEEIKRIVRKTASRHSPFSFSLSKVVYGPSEKQARMVWATGESKKLLSLQKDLNDALARSLDLSFTPEKRPFSLHLTLARFREWEFQKIEPEERPEVNEEISLEVPVSSFQIMESKLKRTGAEYSVIESIPLSP